MATNGMPTGKLRVEAVQTAVPSKPTLPGQTRLILISDPVNRGMFLEHTRLIYYYKKAREDEGGWELGGWLKDSLTTTLAEVPVMAGRLHRQPDSGQRLSNGNEEWMIKLNDGGVRLIQAQFEGTLPEFLELAKEDQSLETQLSYWKGIDAQTPNYSALVYIQLTNFQGDGFSIGLSCSVLLADPFFLTSFVRTWSHNHIKLHNSIQIPKLPMFHLPTVRKAAPYVILPDPTTDNNSYTTLFFKHMQADDQSGMLGLGSFPFEEALRKLKLDARTMANFSLINMNYDGGTEVRISTKDGFIGSPSRSEDSLIAANWGDLRTDETVFQGVNKPIHVSFRVEPFSGEGLVVISAFDEGVMGRLISITLPSSGNIL